MGRILFVLFFVSTFGWGHCNALAGNSASQDAATTKPASSPGPSLSLKEITLEAASDGLLLDGGIFIRMVKQDGSIHLTIKSKLVRRSAVFSRDVTVYVSQPVPTYVIIDDQFASDEDRIGVYDMYGKFKPLTLSHNPMDSYSHQHYVVETARKDGVALTEEEYAGDDKPRKRELVITKTPKGFFVKMGTWKSN